MGSLSLLQGIFPTQGLNPGLLHCRQILYQLSHKGSPKILEWVAYPLSRGSSRPRNRNGVSSIAGRFFSNWAIREVPNESESCSVLSDSLLAQGLYSPWSSPGQNIVVGSFSPSPADLSNPGIELGSPALQGGFFSKWAIREAQNESESHSVLSNSLWPRGLYSAGEGEKLPTPVPWPGELHGLHSISHKESDRLRDFHFKCKLRN